MQEGDRGDGKALLFAQTAVAPFVRAGVGAGAHPTEDFGTVGQMAFPIVGEFRANHDFVPASEGVAGGDFRESGQDVGILFLQGGELPAEIGSHPLQIEAGGEAGVAPEGEAGELARTVAASEGAEELRGSVVAVDPHEGIDPEIAGGVGEKRVALRREGFVADHFGELHFLPFRGEGDPAPVGGGPAVVPEKTELHVAGEPLVEPAGRVEGFPEPPVGDLIDEDVSDLVTEDGDAFPLVGVGVFLVLPRQGHADFFPVGLSGVVRGEGAGEIDGDALAAIFLGHFEKVGHGRVDRVGPCRDRLDPVLDLPTINEEEMLRFPRDDFSFAILRRGRERGIRLGASGFDTVLPRDRDEDAQPYHRDQDDCAPAGEFSPPGLTQAAREGADGTLTEREQDIAEDPRDQGDDAHDEELEPGPFPAVVDLRRGDEEGKGIEQFDVGHLQRSQAEQHPENRADRDERPAPQEGKGDQEGDEKHAEEELQHGENADRPPRDRRRGAPAREQIVDEGLERPEQIDGGNEGDGYEPFGEINGKTREREPIEVEQGALVFFPDHQA